ncbi:MAG: rod shape-determining protein RodA [Parcubacteria group bacterium]|nr:rod shape-determining protein RodA [Parcubacteria group bacterium]
MMEILKKIDWWIMLAAGYLMSVSVLMLRSLPGDGGVSYVAKQSLWIGIGLAIIFALSFLDWRTLFENQIFILSFYLVSVGLVIAVLFLGSRVRGASSWFRLGAFSVEPSEIAKLALLFVFARYFSRRHSDIWLVGYVAVPLLYVLGIIVPVFLQPNFGLAAVLFLMFASLVFFLGLRPKHAFVGIVVFLIVLVVAWYGLLKTYQKERVFTFLNPYRDPLGTGYNALQAKIAIGSSGLLGKGLGQGTQTQLRLLPEARTDFIFAAYTEELGLIGALVLFGAYGIIFIRLSSITDHAINNFSRIFTLAFLLKLYIEMVINVGGNIGLLPITGIALPFVSYGGSNLIVNCIALGIVQSIHIRSRVA